MHEIFYVDIYLILNFMMNFFLLVFTAIIRQKKRMGCRIFFFSLLFAGISAGSTYVFWNGKLWRIGSALFELAAMVYLVFLPRTIKGWRRDMGIFLSVALFCGGGITVFFSLGNILFVQLPVPSLVLIFLSLMLMGAACYLLHIQWAAQRRDQQTMVWVEVFHRGRCLSVKALVDTGNRLISPYTGEGVWIVSQELSGELGLSGQGHPLYIPFHSLGGNGLWEAYRLDRVLVEGKEAYENVLVAVSPHLGEMDEIQMILNIMGS